jgi:hypothetical protein
VSAREIHLRVLSQSLATHQKTRILFSARHIWTSSFRKFSLLCPKFWIIWHFGGLNVGLRRTKNLQEKKFAIVPTRVVVTDKLRSFRAALKDLAPGISQRSHKGLKNRSEGSHRPTRRRAKIMGRFKSPRQAQRFLSVHNQIQTVFRSRRHALSAAAYR